MDQGGVHVTGTEAKKRATLVQVWREAKNQELSCVVEGRWAAGGTCNYFRQAFRISLFVASHLGIHCAGAIAGEAKVMMIGT